MKQGSRVFAVIGFKLIRLGNHHHFISSVTADLDETEVCVLKKPMYFR
ncbi:hypothetical protein NCPPB1935_11815 [Xanthomonas campestris pv. nigromaculans]|nr:hypothetical protein NCPPB1935_11815 [Xanthomonas campestris pv. nigromaculans]